MKPVRQVEAAEHTVAGSTYSVASARALLAITNSELLVQPAHKPKIAANSRAAQEMLGMETERLVKDLKRIEESYDKDLLMLTFCYAYIRKLLSNPCVERHLSRDHSEMLEAIQHAIAE